MYVEELAGPDTVNTMPLATLQAFADHGRVRDALTGTEDEARRTLARLGEAGIDLGAVTERLLREGIEAFEAAMGRLLASIERRHAHRPMSTVAADATAIQVSGGPARRTD